MFEIKKDRTRDLIFYLGLLILPLLQFSIFYVGVNFNSILLALKKIDPLTGEEGWVGFDNFKRVFQDWKEMPLFSYAFKNSFMSINFPSVSSYSLKSFITSWKVVASALLLI